MHSEKLRFGAVYGPVAALGRISSVMIKIGTLWLKIVKNFVLRLDFCKRARAKEIIHNGIERTFTGIKNLIDIKKRFCFI